MTGARRHELAGVAMIQIMQASARPNDFAQPVGLRLIANQMGILFSPVIVQIKRAEIVGVLDQQLQWLRTVLALRQRIAKNLGSEAPPIDGNNGHTWPNAGAGRIHSLDGVFNRAIVITIAVAAWPET